jgi:hypothetical protein
MLTEPAAVALLYTASLAGRLELLPRLMTRIRQERTGYTLLVDLGRACVPGAPICDATDGRGMLVAMDAMGYDAFHIGSADPLYTQPATVEALRQVVQTPFAAGPWWGTSTRKGMVFRFAARPDVAPLNTEPPDLTVVLQLGKFSRADVEADGEQRYLFADGGATGDEPLLGRIDLELTPEEPYIRVVSRVNLSIAHDLMPDPTMTGVIEFVESEARRVKRGPS